MCQGCFGGELNPVLGGGKGFLEDASPKPNPEKHRGESQCWRARQGREVCRAWGVGPCSQPLSLEPYLEGMQNQRRV